MRPGAPSGRRSRPRRLRRIRWSSPARPPRRSATASASVAWLFNIRGGDVIRSPLPLGQAILNADGTASLFLDPRKVSPELPAWLGNEVSLDSPEAMPHALEALKGKRVLVDPALSSA